MWWPAVVKAEYCLLLQLFCTVNVQSAMGLIGGEEGGKYKFYTGQQKFGAGHGLVTDQVTKNKIQYFSDPASSYNSGR